MRLSALFLLISAGAYADTVVLKGGGKIEGRVEVDDASGVTVRTPEGLKKIPRAQVEQVKKAKSIYDTFDAKLADAKDVKALLQLAAWAASNRLYPESIKVYQKVLEQDPNNSTAKKAVADFDKRLIGSNGSGGAASGDRKVMARGNEHVYYLYVPRSYSGQPTPLLLWLHADGGSRRMYLDTLVPLADKYGFLIVSGEGKGTWRGWQEGKESEEDEYLLRAIEETKRQYNVDLVRIFVAGHSRGATYTSRLGADYPELFAGAAMHNGVWVGNQNPGRKTPFFIYTGANDYLAKEYGKAWDAAEKLGHPVKRHEIQGAGHEPRGDAFEEMFKWFQTQALPKKVLWGE